MRTAPEPTLAYVLHPDIRSGPRRGLRDPKARLAEAVSLSAALPGLTIVGAEVVGLPRAHPGTLFGSGKLEALGDQFEALGVKLVLIDGPVSPVQQRNLEKAWDLKILDRTGLILEIFADRARTREGTLQVDLAALSYQRTRLVRAWTHLERQRGGFGFVGGPGETQIEADRRAIDAQILRLRRQLDRVVRTRSLHRAARAKVPFPIVALVGYTNAGKSTLFNRLTGAEVLAADMLFATLDPTLRAITLQGGQKIILSDTVGFISDLPPGLVAAFRATLEEVLEADLIVHVRDISHPETAEQAADVAKILGDLGVKDTTPMIEVWNKLDALPGPEAEAARTAAARKPEVWPISALTGEGVAGLTDLIGETLAQHLEAPRRPARLTIPFAQARDRARLHDAGVVTAETETEDGWVIEVVWTDRQAQAFRRA